MSIDWASLALVTVVTVLVTSFILAITSSAARMLDEAHLKRLAGEVKGLHAAEHDQLSFQQHEHAIIHDSH